MRAGTGAQEGKGKENIPMQFRGRKQRFFGGAWGAAALSLLLIGTNPISARADAGTPAGDAKPVARYNAYDVLTLFSDEMQQATSKLKWRGERLTDDTLYAIALTGLSWQPEWNGKRGGEAVSREAVFEAAAREGQRKETIAAALRLLLEPDAPGLSQPAQAYLDRQGVDVDRVLLGILQAPERLPGLPVWAYPAADLLALHANPRLLPFLLHLANSDDVYLRSRSVIGLGVVAYQPRAGEPPGWEKIIAAPLRSYGLSVSERKMIDREIAEAAASDRYRLRQSAALALALTGDSDSLPRLEKLARDKTYLFLTPDLGRKSPRRIVFPVRAMACAGLRRYGRNAPAEDSDLDGRVLAGKALDKARQGGQDGTNDRRNLRHDSVSRIVLSPFADLPAARKP